MTAQEAALKGASVAPEPVHVVRKAQRRIAVRKTRTREADDEEGAAQSAQELRQENVREEAEARKRRARSRGKDKGQLGEHVMEEVVLQWDDAEALEVDDRDKRNKVGVVAKRRACARDILHAGVEVFVDGLPNFGGFSHCYVDATVVSSNGHVGVHIDPHIGTAPHNRFFGFGRVQLRRGPTLGHNWEADEEVHVLVAIGEASVWREARLVSPAEQEGQPGWIAWWSGCFKGHPPEEIVKTNQLRTATF